MRVVLVIGAAALLAGCGGRKQHLDVKVFFVPRYPTATRAHTTVNASFQSTDWTLPKGTLPSTVYEWYSRTLTKDGWKVTQRNETGLHAERGGSTLDIGVRGSTLEAIAG